MLRTVRLKSPLRKLIFCLFNFQTDLLHHLNFRLQKTLYKCLKLNYYVQVIFGAECMKISMDFLSCLLKFYSYYLKYNFYLFIKKKYLNLNIAYNVHFF